MPDSPPPLDVAHWVRQAAKQVAIFFERDETRLLPQKGEPLNESLRELLVHNATLWGYEDEVRRTDIGDQEVAHYKRLIDQENQRRNNAIDQTDAILLERVRQAGVDQDASLPLNTETPGSAFDRLIILQLRRYHLGREIARADATDEHRRRCVERQREVEERVADLAGSLQALLNDIFAGRRRLKAYSAHKLYNDPETNPAVRQARRR